MIDFDAYAYLVLHFFSQNIFAAVGLGIVVLFFLYKKPLETVKFLAFCCLLVTVIYVMSLLSESSSSGDVQKKSMIRKSEMEIMDSSR